MQIKIIASLEVHSTNDSKIFFKFTKVIKINFILLVANLYLYLNKYLKRIFCLNLLKLGHAVKLTK